MEERRYHADIEVTLRYHDAAYAGNEFLAADKMRRAVEHLFEDLDPLIMDVNVLSPRMVPEEEDILQ